MENKVVLIFKLTVLLIVVFCIIFLINYKSIETFGNHQRPIPSDAAIVLGASVWGDRPSPALRERLEKAVSLYHGGMVEYLIMSGGAAEGRLSEAQVMKEYAMLKGVPESAIIMEDRSFSTWKNLLYSQIICSDLGFERG